MKKGDKIKTRRNKLGVKAGLEGSILNTHPGNKADILIGNNCYGKFPINRLKLI